jgi:phospholipid N-methyltransferase
LNKKSLNREARKRELLKITMENQAFLRRLQDKQPNYNVFKWEEEENDRKRILKNICEYDYIIDQPGL